MQRIVAAVPAILLAALCADLYAGGIHDAAQRGDRASVERLLQADPRLLESADRYGRTPLVCAGQQRKLAVVQLLLSKGAAPDAKSRNRGTLLHAAAEQGNSDLTKLLLEHNASVNAENRYGYTPLYYAALYGKLETAKLLLAAGADPDAKGPSNGNLLHWAAQEGNTDLTKALLEQEPSVNAENRYGYTPLYYAVLHGNLETATLLLAAGADPNAKGPSNGTLLHWAVQQANTDLMTLLLKHKASVDAENRYGYTPLYYAVQASRLDVARLLLDHGADLGPVFSAFRWQTAVNDPDELVRQLGSREPIRLRLAVLALEAMGRKAVPSLIAAMRANDEETRNQAVRLLAVMGDEPLPELGQLLKDPVADVRLRTVFTLGEIGPPAVSLLAEALGDPEHGVRCLAADALVGIGPKGKPAAAAVRKALADENSLVRIHAARALWAIERDPAAVGRLVDCLRAKDPAVRLMAAVALKAVGPAAKVASDALSEATCDSLDPVALAASRALKSIQGNLPTAVHKLNAVVRWQSAERRVKIARALIGIDPYKPPPVAMPRCLGALRQGKEEADWCAAAMVLAAWGSEASPAIPDLSALLQQTLKQETQWCLKWALSCIQPTQVKGEVR
ncbi:MAG: ankyrin repeat domain-containing protein [Planctomycetota bacterium]